MTKSLLCLCDSPTTQSGFARVAQNLIRRWLPHFAKIDVWGIGYRGWPAHRTIDWWPADKNHSIYPGGGGGEWNSPENLARFLTVIKEGDYTHIWIMQDHFMFGNTDFCDKLEAIISKRGIQLLFYVPVDSTIYEHWLRPIALAHVPVAYTEYGRLEILKTAGKLKDGDRIRDELAKRIKVIPHGADFDVYKPVAQSRAQCRQEMFPRGWIGDDDLLFINVNSPQRRKAHWHTIQLFSEIVISHPTAKLLMHVAQSSPDENITLMRVAQQFGLSKANVLHSADCFVNGHPTLIEGGLNMLYNASDFVITTTLGEGWGFSITEGLAAGCRVLAPNHTSCKEIFDKLEDLRVPSRMFLMPLSSTCTVNVKDASRVRWPIDVAASGNVARAAIDYHLKSTDGRKLGPLPAEAREWLSWDRIANEWLALFA